MVKRSLAVIVATLGLMALGPLAFGSPALPLRPAYAACVDPPADMVAWWRAEDNAVEFFSGAEGTLQNGAGFAAGKVGQAFSLDADAGQYVEVPNSSALDLGGEFTIDAWIFINNALDLHQTIVAKNAGVTDPYSLYVDTAGKLNLRIRALGDDQYTSDEAIPTGEFHHVAATYNAGADAGSRVTMYIDGVSVDVTSPAQEEGGVPDAGSGSLYIGREGNTNAFFFDGLIDEVEFFDRVLSQSEIQSIVNAGADGKCEPPPPPTCTPAPDGMVAWWRAEGDAMDFAGDNHGTINGATFANGMVGDAFSFDADGDNIEIPDAPALNPTDAITIDAWVFLTGGQDQHRPLVSKDGATSERQYLLTASENNNFRAHVGVPSGFEFFDGNTEIELNQWYHVAMTYDGATLRLYVNGNLDGSQAVDGEIIQTDQPLRLGDGDPSVADYTLPGLLDEVEIFDRALGADEIQALYEADSAGKCVATIEIVKDVILGAGSFDLLLNGATVLAEATDGSTTGPIEIRAGDHDIGEAGATLGNFLVSATCTDQDGNVVPGGWVPSGGQLLTISVDLGDQWLCKVSNVEIPEECRTLDLTNVVLGTGGRDILRGTSANDLILGFTGNDYLYASGGGDDCAVGGEGDDRLRGDTGDVLIEGNGQGVTSTPDGTDNEIGDDDDGDGDNNTGQNDSIGDNDNNVPNNDDDDDRPRRPSRR